MFCPSNVFHLCVLHLVIGVSISNKFKWFMISEACFQRHVLDGLVNHYTSCGSKKRFFLLFAYGLDVFGYFSLQYIRPQEHEKLSQVELLVVDEAAAIPLPVVKSLLGPYLVFLSSTVNG